MDRIVIWLLVALGAGAALVVAVPGLVVIGGMMLLIPGLVLLVLPTAFVWASLLAVTWWLFRPILDRKPAAVAALGCVAALLWLAPKASSWASQMRLLDAATSAPDVMPAESVPLAGDVLVSVPRLDQQRLDAPTVRGGPAETASRPWVCDALCAALLATPGVRSVTVDAHGDGERPGPLTGHARTFRLVPKEECPGETIRPENPGGLDLDRPQPPPGSRLAGLLSAQAEWDLRLSTRDCIVAGPARQAFDFSILLLRYSDGATSSTRRATDDDWSLRPLPVSVERIALSDAGGRVVLRKTLATTRALASPLHVGAQGGLENFRFQWGRTELSNGTRYERLRPHALLDRLTSLHTTADEPAIVEAARARLARMVDDPAVSAEDPGFDLVAPWFASFDRPAAAISAADRELLRRLIADGRITDFPHLYAPVRAMGPDAVVLRPAIGRRLAEADPPGPWMKTLAAQLERMPAGTFATATPVEQAILADPSRRLYAGGLIVRQADRGEAAVPLLVEIMQSHWARLRAPGRKAWSNDDMLAIDAARRAFCVLGPQAAAALPAIDEMTTSGLIGRNTPDRSEWHLMLARMGRPVESIAKPDSRSGTAESFHTALRRQLDGFDPERHCRAEWM